MINVYTPGVRRRWYVAIEWDGITSRAVLATASPGTGQQTWLRIPWGTDMQSLTETEILDELWSAATSLMEARTHLP